MRAGFTLVELLVTLALSLFILSLFTSLFISATQGTNQMKSIAAADQRVRNASNILRRDLKSAAIQIGSTGVTKIVQPHLAFTPNSVSGTDGWPSGGYFSIEENSPALRQGVDQWGQPVEVDTDDVLAFTAQREGSGRAEMFYGRVPRSADSRDLDAYGTPRARFDVPDNGLVSSRRAEIVYFLRPQRQYTADEVRGHNSIAPWTSTVTTNPALYTLHRKQLVILDDNTAAAFNANSSVNPISARNFFQLYDVSAKLRGPAGAQTVSFNTFSEPLSPVPQTGLQNRRRRFGLNDDPTIPDNPPVFFNDFPFSWWVDAPVGGFKSSSVSASYFVPWTAGGPQWFGRPTALELGYRPTSTPVGPTIVIQGKPMLTDQNPTTDYDPIGTIFSFFSGSGPAIVDGDDNGIFDGNDVTGAVAGGYSTYATKLGAINGAAKFRTVNYDAGADILLTDVLSFDIKVLDDDPRIEPVQVLASSAHPTMLLNPYLPMVYSSASPPTVARVGNEFVDLGYLSSGARNNQIWSPANLLTTSAPLIAQMLADINAGYTVGVGGYAPFQFTATSAHGPFGFEQRWRLAGAAALANSAGTPVYAPQNTYDTWSNKYPPAPGPTFRSVPYPKPLRAIQIRLRILEPTSKITREVTLIHRFDREF